MIRSSALVAMAFALAVLTAGCATTLHQQQVEQSRSDAGMLQAARANLAAQPSAEWSVQEGVFLGSGEVIALPVNDGRNELLDRTINIGRGNLMTLPQVAETIQSLLSVRVTVMSDALEAAAEQPGDPFQADVSGVAALGAALVGVGGTSVGGDSRGAIPVQFEGTLRGLLDYVTIRTGTYWEWSDGGLVIARFMTRTYRVTAIPGRSGLTGRLGSSSASGGGSGGASGGGGSSSTTSEQSATMEVDIDVIGPVLSAIESMLSSGGQVAAMPGMGLFTVTDVPVIHQRVAALVESVNEMATRQAIIDVQLVSIDLTDAESYGINWEIVREALTGRAGFNLVSVGDALQGANTASYAVIDPTYNYFGSSVLLQALETQGHVRVTANQAVPVLSNAPTPVNIVDEISYLAEVESNVVPQSGLVQLRLTPGTVSVGLSMQMLPVILDNDDVLLQFSSTISNLRELRTVAGGTGPNASRIEVPSVSKRDSMHRVRLRSGQTLALWGFEQERGRTESRGNGAASFILGGGSRNSQNTRTVLVVLVTPRRMV